MFLARWFWGKPQGAEDAKGKEGAHPPGGSTPAPPPPAAGHAQRIQVAPDRPDQCVPSVVWCALSRAGEDAAVDQSEPTSPRRRDAANEGDAQPVPGENLAGPERPRPACRRDAYSLTRSCRRDRAGKKIMSEDRSARSKRRGRARW